MDKIYITDININKIRHLENITIPLQKEMNILYTLLKKYKDNPNSPLILKKLKVTLRKESAFAGFKRSFIRENIDSYANLISFI